MKPQIIQGHRLALTGLCAVLSFAMPSAQAFDCWVNEDGVKECGEIVPQEYVPKGHEVLSHDGRVVRRIAPEMSKEERERLMQQKVEEERKRAEEKRQQEQDKRLLDLYPTEDDIIQAREGKILSVRARIRMTQTQYDFYERSLKEAQKAREQQANSLSKEEKENLDADITQLKAQMDKFLHTIEGSKQEIEAIRIEFEEHQRRYLEIQARGGS